ncbi:hypothetical protein BUE80_DR013854 [Diplocarpon rosae]|nr:hypothetical protein BUE80_DR013854 [Diplocarpon rosae]
MKFSTLAASIVSLFAIGTTYAADSVECAGFRFFEPIDLLSPCNMFYVEDSKAWRANCGWGTLDWSKGTDDFGKITLKNFNQKTILFSFDTIGDNGQQRSYVYALDPQASCTEDLDPRYEVQKVSADLQS